MATNRANITAVITAEDKASAVVAGFGKNVEKSQKDVSSSISASAVAVGVATAGIVAFGKKSLDAFNAQDLATVRLQTGINNVRSATDKSIKSLLEQASALQKTTRFSDEAYISAQGILSTFQLNQKAITALTPRLADMSEGLARVTGEMPDLEGNAILIAKAIGGEDTAGLTGALRRAGVVMTNAQQELLKTGTVEERVALVTKVLDQNFANMAETAGKTTSGKMTELRNQFGELEEKVGQVIATALTPFINLMLQHPAILTAATIAIGALTTAFIALKVAAAISTVITGVSAALTAMTGAASSATVALSTLSAVSIAGWAALVVADLYLVKRAADAVKGAWEAVYNAQRAADNLGNEGQIRNLQKQATAARAMGDTKKVTQIANAIAALGGGRAAGGPINAGTPYLVGEQGPEIVVPNQSGTVIPNHQLGGGGGVNITIQAGAFMGSDVEARKFAQTILSHLRDAAGSKNMSLQQMMGS
jgi:hypothetical protein